MRGCITNRDVVANLGLIWSEFGAFCAFKCLFAMVRGEATTFLDVACKRQAAR